MIDTMMERIPTHHHRPGAPVYEHMQGDLNTTAPAPRRSRARVLWVITGAAFVVAAAAVLYATGVITGSGHQVPKSSGSSGLVAADESVEHAAPSTAQEPTFEITGHYEITGQTADLADGATCGGTGPDGKPIGGGTPVHVYDRDGHQVAVGTLSAGTYASAAGLGICRFAFTVPDVPDGLPRYGLEVGTYGVHQVSSLRAHDGPVSIHN